ncbi:hypothetical protein [Nocardiopsis potens]|uniref:hypothetical protein n=1 Tax=Nocardiopsis potens TaxID=1246458 RepID=UPI0003473E3D|nr:hypothetical protein [Nocardiopsis potens]
MRMECLGNRGTDLPVQDVDHYGTEHTRFDVTVGREYTVYALTMAGPRLDVLIADDTGKPGWYPAPLFRVTDPALPAHWEFAYPPTSGQTDAETLTGDTARWGYPEAVRSERHGIGLVERDPDDLLVFYREQQRYREEPEKREEREG